MLRKLLSAVWLMAAAPALASTTATQHVVVMIDESPSMKPRLTQVLDALQTLGWTIATAAGDAEAVSFSVIGFTSEARLISIEGRDVFTAAELPDALSLIRIVRDGREDGYRAIALGLDRLASVDHGRGHLLLITDEDRDAADASLDRATMLERLHQDRVRLDVILNARFGCSDGARALGQSGERRGFQAAAGGYAECAALGLSDATGTSFLDYAAPAMATGGSVWDVGALARRPYGRAGVRPSDPGGQPRPSSEALSQAYAALVTARDTVTADATARPLARPAEVWPNEAVVLRGDLSDSSAAHDAVYEWAWDLDTDGVPDRYGPEIAYAFADAGLHRVTLTVRGAGRSATAPLWIRVRPPN